jgi:rfaE bifunctional protein kinase chain/domain
MFESNINKLKNKKILLLGDFFLDEFFFGESERISPEAPVPVIKPQKSDFSLGGAGNVLLNLTNLGIKTIPLGILGSDPISKNILEIIKKKKLNFKNFILDKSYNGILKKRILVKNQHLARIDYENIDFQLPIKHKKKIESKILNLIKKCDLVVISDYGKGSLSDEIIKFSIDSANDFEVPTVVDPRKKKNDYTVYSGASFITPNLEELRSLFPNILNDNLEIIKACEFIKKKYHIQNILVTRGDKGITLYNGKQKYHSKSAAKEVFDVAGAGDTVVAVLSACLLLNINIKKTIRLANLCAGYVISFRGTKPIVYNKFKKFLKSL